VRKNALAESCRTENKNPCNSSNTNCNLVKPRYTPFKNAGNWAKPESDFVAMSQGEYLLQLDKNCGLIDDAKYAQNNNNGCNKCALPGNR
jgi:hypothetical protein